METQPNPTQPNPTQPNSTQPYPTHKNNKPTHTFPSTRPLFFSATRPLSPPTRRPLLLPTAAAITFLPCPLRPSPSISWSGGLVSADISLSDTDETAAPDDYGLVGGDSAVFDLGQENFSSWVYFSVILGSVLAALEVLWIDNSTGYGGAFVDAVAAVSDSHEEDNIDCEESGKDSSAHGAYQNPVLLGSCLACLPLRSELILLALELIRILGRVWLGR